MRYKTELDYIKSLNKADFDPCTLSVQGYAEEFQEHKDRFGYDFFSFFFCHPHLISKSSIENFLDLIWVTNNLKDALEFENDIFSLCESTDAGVADRALNLFDHASCEDDIEFDYTKLLNLDIKISYLKEYAKSIAGIKK
jgi:hypothetical protein